MRSATDGLASAYQITQVTDGGGPAVLETGGNLLIGIITFPHSEILPLTPYIPESSANESKKEFQNPDKLAIEMSENKYFMRLVERGISNIEQGHYTKISKEKIESGVI